MLDAEDVDTVLHMLDVCYGEGIGPRKEKVNKLLKKLVKLINSTTPLEAYSGIPEVDRVLKELA